MAIEINDSDKDITSYLKTHTTAVLATSNSDNIPHASTIYYFLDKEYNFIFLTKTDTTKAKNLIDNPHAALCIYDESDQSTIQIQGSTTYTQDVNIIEEVFGMVISVAVNKSNGHNPPITKIDAGTYIVFTLRPKYIRMGEYVKEEYPPTTEIFDVVTDPDQVLE